MQDKPLLRLRPLILATGLVACAPAVPSNEAASTNESAAAGTLARRPVALQPSKVTEADPEAAQIDFASLAGRWKVVGVAPGDGVQALVRNDPAYMGRIVVIGPDRLMWADGAAKPAANVGDRCDGPVTQRLTGTAAVTIDATLAAQVKALGVTAAAPHAVECETGNWGPEAAGGATLYAGRDVLAFSWYDGVILKLIPAGR